MRELSSPAEVDAISGAYEHEPDRIEALCKVYWRPQPPAGEAAGDLDPFSPAFRHRAVQFLLEINGKASYDPVQNEKSSCLEPVATGPVVPDLYQTGDSAWLGEMVQSHGGVLKALDVRRGQSVLEYGPGDGQIALHLARMGCAVTVVDVEGVYLSRIRAQATAFPVEVKTIEGLFGTAEPGVKYDRILFYESFHHALDHHDLVGTSRAQLAPSGLVVFAGEPILAHDDHFRPVLPYAWGPRLDGLSLRAMRNYGWCELGYAREYFIELLMRAGFTLTYRPDPAAGRASAYVAKLRGDTVDLAGPCVLEAWGAPDCWHPGEGNIRWSRTELAVIPVDCTDTWSQLQLGISNYLPFPQTVECRFGDRSETVTLQHRESTTLTFQPAANASRIEIRCPVRRICDALPGNADTRTVGIAVSTLAYQP